jgi:hypothetical protein
MGNRFSCAYPPIPSGAIANSFKPSSSFNADREESMSPQHLADANNVARFE